MAGAVLVVPATIERWPEFGWVFGPRAKDPTSCWCQRFLRHEEPDNRTALQREVQEAELPVGPLAYRDDVAVGWTRVVPRSTLPGITENRALARILDEDPDAWWVSCSSCAANTAGAASGQRCSRPRWTGRLEHGASVLDGHPVDTNGLAGTPSPSAIFTGTLDMFQRAGFTEIGRTYRTRPVMRHTLLRH